ncbi:hypothetical protein LINPERHAP1_LOCUS24438 [Linum perenne]
MKLKDRMICRFKQTTDKLRFRIPLRSPEHWQSTDQQFSVLIQSISKHHHNS